MTDPTPLNPNLVYSVGCLPILLKHSHPVQFLSATLTLILFRIIGSDSHYIQTTWCFTLRFELYSFLFNLIALILHLFPTFFRSLFCSYIWLILHVSSFVWFWISVLVLWNCHDFFFLHVETLAKVSVCVYILLECWKLWVEKHAIPLLRHQLVLEFYGSCIIIALNFDTNRNRKKEEQLQLSKTKFWQ